MDKKLFGVAKSGEEIYLYILENKNGVRAEVMNYGANLVRLYVPDKTGKVEDIVFGFDRLEDYYHNGNFFGCTVGPNANRIENAKVTIEGATYQLNDNDGGNNLHSDGRLGYHKRVWVVESMSEDSSEITFYSECANGEMGLPGNKCNRVTYSLNDENELKIHYHVTTDKKTLINMTNHSYFNLSGKLNKTIRKHELQMKCSRYTPLKPGGIPTGEIAETKGTPMDFSNPKAIGTGLVSKFQQIQMCRGYDHNFCIDGWDDSLKTFATVYEPESGRTMEVSTTLPGVQLYTANCVGICPGKELKLYRSYGALCLETQYYPNNANVDNFPKAIFGPDKPYDATTVYKFGVR